MVGDEVAGVTAVQFPSIEFVAFEGGGGQGDDFAIVEISFSSRHFAGAFGCDMGGHVIDAQHEVGRHGDVLGGHHEGVAGDGDVVAVAVGDDPGADFIALVRDGAQCDLRALVGVGEIRGEGSVLHLGVANDVVVFHKVVGAAGIEACRVVVSASEAGDVVTVALQTREIDHPVVVINVEAVGQVESHLGLVVGVVGGELGVDNGDETGVVSESGKLVRAHGNGLHRGSGDTGGGGHAEPHHRLIVFTGISAHDAALDDVTVVIGVGHQVVDVAHEQTSGSVADVHVVAEASYELYVAHDFGELSAAGSGVGGLESGDVVEASHELILLAALLAIAVVEEGDGLDGGSLREGERRAIDR